MAPCQWFSPCRTWTTSPTVISCWWLSSATMPMPAVTTSIWSLLWVCQPVPQPFSKLTILLLKVLRALRKQRLSGAFDLSAGPAWDGRGGVDGFDINLGDSDYPHMFLLDLHEIQTENPDRIIHPYQGTRN